MSFSSFVGSVFSNTQFINNAKYSAASLGINIGLHYINRGGQLKFVSPRGYDDVITYAARRTMMQLAYAKINNLYPSYIRDAEKNRITKALDENKKAQGLVVDKEDKKKNETIISKYDSQDETIMGKHDGAIIKYMGRPIPEALILWIPNDPVKKNSISINTYWDKVKNLSNGKITNEGIKANTTITLNADQDNVFWDLGPVIQMQSNNNVVLTQVQGRDYSRKELISGGDINFTVTGKIVSNYPDVYPYEMVSKFITLMQTKGVLHVSNLMFSQFNVTQILIKDFQMSQTEGFKNVQPYSFTCVGVEPDKDVQVIQDTIQINNLNIQRSGKVGWSTQLLKKIKSTAANQAAQMIEQLTSKNI